MQNEQQGRLIDIAATLARHKGQAPGASAGDRAGKAIFLEPRTIRHQERVEDLFYLLFRRTGT